ncbi:hypothetical protein CYMTET_3047 [Cymbomonas tetramitiformis]|uniref:Peptidase M1 alanyl aminopeptidase C-terminal domain-containing protein n=1 Tax=Cymbomonas tetramitiformis TaxID=36881 RepID=A0AAE0LLH7_9CHLO|nr:hypothetical protein CYMTET_3047 [Cymbomonas tetramitiformis]
MEGWSEDELLFLLGNDSDEFNRWEAGQRLSKTLIASLVEKCAQGEELELGEKYITAMRSVVCDANLDKSFAAAALSIPSENEIAELLPGLADPAVINTVRSFIRKSLAAALQPELETVVQANSEAKYSNEYASRAKRSLKNAALGYLATLKTPAVVTELTARFRAADNMTDQTACLAALVEMDCPERLEAVEAFYQQWKDDPLVMNKWLGLQAMSNLQGNVATVQSLLQHPAFDIKNPNKVYSLVGGFCNGSPVNFHASDGSGYKLLGDVVLQVDQFNPQVASRMVGFFTRWKKYEEGRQTLMKEQLKRILDTKGLSENTFEIVSKSI